MFRIKYCREIVLKILYQIDVLNTEPPGIPNIIENFFKYFKGPNQEERDFINKLIEQVIRDKEDIDQLITKNLIGWKFKRLTPIDRNLLRMGVAESRLMADKKSIVIDDIIRIAKKYSDQDSYKFINAILDKVIS